VYSTPTVSDFKSQFPRDFPYAIAAYGAAAETFLTAGAVSSITVLAGGVGYAEAPTVVFTPQPGDTGSGASATATVANGQVTGFTAIVGGGGYLLPPLISFVGGDGDNTNLNRVTDDDLNGAIADAGFNVSPGLFGSQAQFSRAFLYLAAHQLIEKLLMAAAGVQSRYSWLTVSKAVAGVSESFKIPAVVADNPFLANISKTRYGAMYIQIVAPLLVGNVSVDCTYTNP
jgi:hypothetical protein